jgi:hypothetical protein
MKICFYTEAHLGDFLFAAPFIKLLVEKYPGNQYYQYIYGSDGTVFPDIFMKTVPGLIPTKEMCGDINIPTWLCNKEYSELLIPSTETDQTFPGLEDTFFVHQRAWKFIFKKHGFDIKIPDDLGINFDYDTILDSESISKIKSVGNNSRKKILFLNHKGKSGQTDNQDWINIIFDFASNYRGWDFYYTNKEEQEFSAENIFYTPDVFGNFSSDILHNSYLSIFCDIIVGRFSGAAVASSMHDANVKNVNKILITQTQDNVHKADLEVYFNKKLYKATNIHSHTTKESFDILEKILCQL